MMRITAFFFFVLFHFLLTANQKFFNDSIVGVHFKKNNDSALFYIHKNLQLSKQENDSIWYAYSLTYMGAIQKELGILDSAVYYTKKAVSWQKLIDFPEGMAGAQNNLASIYRMKGDYIQAILNYKEAIISFQLLEDEKHTVDVAQNLAELYILLGKEGEAQILMTEIEKYCLENNYFFGLSHFYRSKADIAFLLGKDLDEIIKVYYQSIYYAEQSNRPIEVSRTLNKLIRVFIQNDKWREADSLIKYNYVLSEEHNSKYELLELKVLHGKWLNQNGYPNKTIQLLESAHFLDREVNALSLEVELYEVLKIAFHQLGMYKKAYDTAELYFHLKDSLTGKELQKAFEEIEINYKVKDKDNEIIRLNDKSKIQELENEKLKLASEQSLQNRNRWIIFTVFMLLVAILFIQKFFQKRKLSLKLKKSLLERELLIKEIHHRVKNNLQIVNSLLNIQSKLHRNPTTQKILKESKDRIHTMAIIHEKLYLSDNLTNVSVQEYFANLTEYFTHSYQLENRDILIKNKTEEVKMNIDQIVPLGLMFNELISNAIKYAFDDEGGEIVLQCFEKENFITFIISDSGKGLPENWESLSQSSLGMKLVQGLSLQLKGKYQFENTMKGMKFTLQFKINNE